MSRANPYQQAFYLKSVHYLKNLPEESGYEVAFAGRSNAGKSSAINVLCQQKGLARTSKTPGRTQQIVYFQVDEKRLLADLPGYGYAKVPVAVKAHWHSLMEGYFEQRRSLRGVVVIMDIRHPLKTQDVQMLNWCGAAGVPAHVLLTKADKLKRGAARRTLREVSAQVGEIGQAQIFSAVSREGLDGLIAQLNQWLELATGDDKPPATA